MIPYGRQHITPLDIAAVDEALRADFLTCGEKVTEFERALCHATGARHAIACANGTAALHLACLALGVSPGTRAVTSPITFVATANCVEFCGGSTDFVDIDAATRCLSPALLENYCRSINAPHLVLPVSFAGVCADLPKLFELKKKYNFYLVEDAAHSLGSEYQHDGKTYQSASCAHTDCAILSFHPVKTITTGEGGAVTTNSDEIAHRLRIARGHGIVREKSLMSGFDGPWYYEMQSLGFNYRITDIQCALGLSQLHRLREYKERRMEIAAEYSRELNDIEEIEIPQIGKKS